jgi:hypothetical protein
MAQYLNDMLSVDDSSDILSGLGGGSTLGRILTGAAYGLAQATPQGRDILHSFEQSQLRRQQARLQKRRIDLEASQQAAQLFEDIVKQPAGSMRKLAIRRWAEMYPKLTGQQIDPEWVTSLEKANDQELKLYAGYLKELSQVYGLPEMGAIANNPLLGTQLIKQAQELSTLRQDQEFLQQLRGVGATSMPQAPQTPLRGLQVVPESLGGVLEGPVPLEQTGFAPELARTLRGMAEGIPQGLRAQAEIGEASALQLPETVVTAPREPTFALDQAIAAKNAAIERYMTLQQRFPKQAKAQGPDQLIDNASKYREALVKERDRLADDARKAAEARYKLAPFQAFLKQTGDAVKAYQMQQAIDHHPTQVDLALRAARGTRRHRPPSTSSGPRAGSPSSLTETGG